MSFSHVTDITPGAFNRLILIQQQDHPYVIEALPQAPSSYHFLSLLSFQSMPDATIFVPSSLASVALSDHQNGSYQGHWTFTKSSRPLPGLTLHDLVAAYANVDHSP